MRVLVLGVDEAVNKIDKHFEDIFESKMKDFQKRLADVGLNWLNFGVTAYKTEEYESMMEIDEPTWIDEHTLAISITGEDVTFFEFGTGVHREPQYQEPDIASELGMERGEYGHGWGKRWAWYYYDSSGELVKTRGFATDYNLIGSAREMRHSIRDVTMEVFG